MKILKMYSCQNISMFVGQNLQSLLASILRNWRILVKYFIIKLQEEKDSKANGMYKVLTDINKLKLLCFLTDL